MLQRAILKSVRAAARIRYGTNTLGAAVAVLEVPRVLFVRDIHRRQELVLPGGFVRRGEEPAAAACRELNEEVGLIVDLSTAESIVKIDGRFPHIHFLWRLSYLSDVHGDVSHKKSWETLTCEWHDLSALPRDVSPETREQLRALSLIR